MTRKTPLSPVLHAEEEKANETPVKWRRVSKHPRPRRLRQTRRRELTVSQILEWADHEFRATGRWPGTKSRHVLANRNEKWCNIDAVLRIGGRGLPCNSSLPQLLAKHRGVRNSSDLPHLTEREIAAWAEAHHQRTGVWPTQYDGPVEDSPCETWVGIHKALYEGLRGLPGADSLGRLIGRHFGVRNRTNIPRLTIKQILLWADTHRSQTGNWPVVASGPILGAPGETWLGVDSALREGLRGFKGGASLTQTLTKYRGARNKAKASPFTLRQILAWADAHHQRTGQWPTQHSGPVVGAKGETWVAVQAALLKGCRGLPGGNTIRKLLVREGRIPKRLKSDLSLRVAPRLRESKRPTKPQEA